MKRPLLILLLLLLVCVVNAQNWNDSVQIYISEARMLNAKAYVKLAKCYHKGLGVKQNFPMMMLMLKNANMYGEGNLLDEYIASLPENDVDRLIFNAFMDLRGSDKEDAEVIKEKLLEVSPQAGKVFNAIICVEIEKDTVSFVEILSKEMGEGNFFAGYILSLQYDADEKIDDAAKIWKAIAEQIPAVYCNLGEYYCTHENNVLKAVECYRNADKYACLDKRGAKLLLQEEKELSKKEKKRLNIIKTGIGG